MNLIDKLIDSRSIPDQMNCKVETNLFPDFRKWSDSMLFPSSSNNNNSNSNFVSSNMFNWATNILAKPMKTDCNMNIDIPGPPMNNETEEPNNNSEEDFCDQCQKKFCNKYYLKKHKSEVHKIDSDISSNPFEAVNLINENQNQQQKTPPIFRPPIFNPFLNHLSNLYFNKSLSLPFPNFLLSSLPPHSNSTTNSLSTSSSFHDSSEVSPQTSLKFSQTPSVLAVSNDSLNSNNPNHGNLDNNNPSSKLPNISNSLFDEIKSSLIKLPNDLKPPPFNLIDGNYRDLSTKPKNIPCNICGIQVLSETELMEHIYLIHSKETTASGTGGMNQDFSKLASHQKKETSSPTANSESYMSPFDAFKSSMAAAKLADRVTCDICHKDLCNKYFLRTHKLKLHGVQTIDSNCRSGSRKDKPSGMITPKIEHFNPNSSFINSPFNRASLPENMLNVSLLQSGPRLASNSPETGGSFCPICKRSVGFYLLNLHLWNAHGISMAGQSSFLSPLSNNRPTNFEPNILDSNFGSINMASKINPSFFPLPFSNNGIDTTALGSKWYRKSPNQMRVRCEICDKWICNKYFLRTHKLNKHGLADNSSTTDVNSDSASRSYLMDATSAPNSSGPNAGNANDSQTNSKPLEDEISPIDLSSSPHNKDAVSNSNRTEPQKPMPNFPVSAAASVSNFPNFSFSNLWNSSSNLPWPLRFSLDRLNVSSNSVHMPTHTTPLDLSIKNPTSKTNHGSYSAGKISRTIVLSAAKRLKLKYQKMKKIRYLQNSFLSKKTCPYPTNTNSNNSKALIECFSCPLCRKELFNANSFIQHLTQFHDMVLPNSHSDCSNSRLS